MNNSWKFISSTSIKYNALYRGILSQIGQKDPFANLPWLLRDCSNTSFSGIYIKNKVVLHTKNLTWRSMGIGSYVQSELEDVVSTISSQDLGASLIDFPQWLVTQSTHCIFAEGSRDSFIKTGLLKIFARAKWAVCIQEGTTKSVINLPSYQIGSTFFDFVGSRNKKELRSLESSIRKIKKLKNVNISQRIGTITDEEIDVCRKVEKKSWKCCQGIFSDDIFEKTKVALQSNTVLISIITIDNEPAAWDIDIIHNNVLYSYNRAYKEIYRKYAFGKFLHYSNIEFAWQKGVCRVELLGSSDAFKNRIADEHKERVRAVFFSNKPSGFLLQAGYKIFLLTKKLRNLFK